MVKMVSLKKSAADKAAEKKAMGEPTIISRPDEDVGVTVRLDHHHLTKMGVHGDLKSGDDVEFHGKGKVERSETRSTPDGDRHSATVRLHRAGIESVNNPWRCFRGRDQGKEWSSIRRRLW